MKKFLISMICLGLILVLSACSSSLSKYEWGEPLRQSLEEIKVKSIKSIKDETSAATKELVADVKVETDKRVLSVLLSKNSNGTWDVLSISDDDDYNIIYYEKDYLQVDDNGNQITNIYDYTTGEVIKKAISKNADNQTLTKAELESKTKNVLHGYKITALDILTRTAGDGFIVSVQIDGDINKKELLEIANKIAYFNKFYQIQIVNNGKLILSYDQDSK